MRVLLSAYACEPDKGSEPADGWMWVHQIARWHEVWVITRVNNRESIEKAMAKEPLPNVHWVYFDLPRWARFWKRQQRGVHVYYALWQLAVYFVARRLHREHHFDIAHHVTIGQYWTPSSLGLLPVPFVWGPVGGGESSPRAFWWDFSTGGKRFELMRNLARGLSSINPVLRASARRSRVAIATTEQTASRLRALHARTVVIHPQFGMTPAEMRYFRTFPMRRSSPFRLVGVGRLLHWKGFHLSLRAFAKFQASYPDSEYWILSRGPESDRLKAMARELGVESKVIFWGGFATIQEVYAKIAECDVLVHPALHEAFGNVCLEGMAIGRPVVCLDLGGPALQVTPETGIKVPAVSPEQVIHDLAAAFSQLAGDPEARIKLGEAAQLRAEQDFDWNTHGEWMNRIYSLAKDGGGEVNEDELVPRALKHAKASAFAALES